MNLAELLELPIHPVALWFPWRTDDELEALAEQIQEYGQREPIRVGRNGTMVFDGKNRIKACDIAGIEPVVQLVEMPTEKELEFIFSLNCYQRQMKRETQRDLISKLLLDNSGRSDREIGTLVGCSHHTVARVRALLEATGQVAQSDTRIGADGRQRPASQPPRPPSEEEQLAARLQGEAQATAERIRKDRQFNDSPCGRLVMLLNHFSNENEGERLNAANAVTEHFRTMNVTWEKIVRTYYDKQQSDPATWLRGAS